MNTRKDKSLLDELLEIFKAIITLSDMPTDKKYSKPSYNPRIFKQTPVRMPEQKSKQYNGPNKSGVNFSNAPSAADITESLSTPLNKFGQ